MVSSYHDSLQLHENRIDSTEESDGMRHKTNIVSRHTKTTQFSLIRPSSNYESPEKL